MENKFLNYIRTHDWPILLIIIVPVLLTVILLIYFTTYQKNLSDLRLITQENCPLNTKGYITDVQIQTRRNPIHDDIQQNLCTNLQSSDNYNQIPIIPQTPFNDLNNYETKPYPDLKNEMNLCYNIPSTLCDNEVLTDLITVNHGSSFPSDNLCPNGYSPLYTIDPTINENVDGKMYNPSGDSGCSKVALCQKTMNLDDLQIGDTYIRGLQLMRGENNCPSGWDKTNFNIHDGCMNDTEKWYLCSKREQK